MTDGARDITVDHNTVVQVNASGVVQIDGPPVLGFVYTNNLSKYGSYGIAGTGRGSGNSAISAYLPGSDITRNVMAGAPAAELSGRQQLSFGRAVRDAIRLFRGGRLSADRDQPLARLPAPTGRDLGAPLGAVP